MDAVSFQHKTMGQGVQRGQKILGWNSVVSEWPMFHVSTA